MKFAEKFNEARKNDPRTEKELVSLLGLSIRAYYNYANGTTCPKVDDLPLFENVFNKPHGWFLGIEIDEKSKDLKNKENLELKELIKKLEEVNKEEKQKNSILNELADFQRNRISSLESLINHIKDKLLDKIDEPVKNELKEILDIVKEKK